MPEGAHAPKIPAQQNKKDTQIKRQPLQIRQQNRLRKLIVQIMVIFL